MEEREGKVGGEWTAGGKGRFHIYGSDGLLAARDLQEIAQLGSTRQWTAARLASGDGQNPPPCLAKNARQGWVTPSTSGHTTRRFHLQSNYQIPENFVVRHMKRLLRWAVVLSLSSFMLAADEPKESKAVD